MSIAIVTDGSVDVPEDVLAEYGIEVVPPVVIIGDKEYLSGVDISPSEFFRQQRTSPILPRTSQPSPGQFADAFERALAHHDRVFYIGVSGALSGTINSAKQAASAYSPGTVVIHDSRMVSAGGGLQVVAAARALSRGASMEELVEVAQCTLEQSQLYFSADDLTYLIKGGRVGRVAGAIGSFLNVRPVIGMDKASGTIMPVERVRTFRSVINKLVELCAAVVGEGGPGRFVLLYGEVEDEAVLLRDLLHNRFDVRWFRMLMPAPTLCAHIGPRALGVAVLPGDWE